MNAFTAVFLMLFGYVAMCTGTNVFHSQLMSVFGLLLVITTGAALIIQSEVK